MTDGAIPLRAVHPEVSIQPHPEGSVPAVHPFRMAIGEGNDIVLKSIDTCVPKAPNFGVADTNVLK